MSSLSPRIKDIEKRVFENEIEIGLIEAPFTSIVNSQGTSRKIPDLANDLKAHMGVERVHVKSIKLVHDEFGPLGEPVWQASHSDPRVRFIGSAWTNSSGSSGTRVLKSNNGTPTTKLEITFFGTGLNILMALGRAELGTAFNLTANTDNTGDQTILNAYNGSTVLDGRNIESNQIVPIVSGLSLGVHTTTLTYDVGTFTFHGFEVVTESSQLVVNPGKPRLNSKNTEILNQQLLPYKPASLTGTKGGRVVTYLNEDGTLGQAVTEVDEVFTGNPLAPELITNGDFSTGDLTGWTNDSQGAGTASVNVSNQLEITTTGVGGNFGRIYQAITTVANQLYTISFDTISGSNNNVVYVYDGASGTSGTLIDFFNLTGNSSDTFSFKALSSSTSIVVTIWTESAGNVTYDNLSVKEAAYNFLALQDTDHSNEEVVRKINFREFGRGDSFSTLTSSTSSRAFTLDDGTTTLTGNNISAGTSNPSSLRMINSSSYIVLTFVGTGLDITGVYDDNLVYGNLTIDGITIDNISRSNNGRQKICSNLPYGSHTVKIDNSIFAGVQEFLIDFIIYQPKKPELPSTAIQEIADYNVMADYIENNTGGNIPSSGFISQGVLRKQNLREVKYTGTWSTTSALGDPSGVAVISTTGTPSFEFTFFGTGFDLWSRGGAGSTVSLIEIDKHDGLGFQVFNDTNFPGIAANATYSGAGGSFNSATGQMTTSTNWNGRLTGVKDLSLGKYTVKVTCTGSVANTFELQAIDVITPIHINSSDLKTGSLSLKDLTVTDEDNKPKIDLTRAKAWLYYDQVNSTVLSSYNISAVLNTSAGVCQVFFKTPFKNEKYITVGSSNYAAHRVLVAINFKANTAQITTSTVTQVLENGIFSVVFFGELENEENIDLEDL